LGKGILRTLLSKYLKINSICFKYNNQSKPFIENSINLKFNISHSHKTLTFAFTLENDIGVDIEYNKRSIEIPQIAKRFFSKNEATELLALKKNEWLPTFYNCWTRKEAFIKAKGGGLSIPLDQFEVSILSNENVELKVIQWDQNDVKNWKMEAFNCRGDYTGATIVNSSNSIFYYYDCDSLSII
jgi:4'-phosphopantetheinyl transferase